MSKSDKQIKEELDNSRKRYEQKNNINQLRANVLKVFDELKILKDDMNISYATSTILGFFGDPPFIPVECEHIRIIIKMSHHKYTKKHEVTPLFKAINGERDIDE